MKDQLQERLRDYIGELEAEVERLRDDPEWWRKDDCVSPRFCSSRRDATDLAHPAWQRDDSEIINWLEQNGRDVHLCCWNVLGLDEYQKDNGWTVECRGEEIGVGLTLRMAVSDAIHHPERLNAAKQRDAGL